ncbi:MAG: amylo-alpha-1,6-glucosidase [Coriobacteriia bacterium]
MSDDPLGVGDEYGVLTTSAPIDDRTRILKLDDTFGVFDRFGDIEPFDQSHLGLYRGDTRFLSTLRLRLENGRPLLLDSTVSQDNSLFRVDLMNVDLRRGEEIAIPHGTVHVCRSKAMEVYACAEQVCFHNYSLAPVEISFSIEFAADFADIFEIRGVQRARRGRLLAPQAGPRGLLLAYQGLDGRRRETRIELDPVPAWRGETEAFYRMTLQPHAEATYRWTIVCELEGDQAAYTLPVRYERAVERAEAAALEVDGRARVISSNDQFNDWVNRSAADIRMLTTETPCGPYPYAGVPWFSTAFGRDGIITALECLWFDPGLAKGVLTYLACTQASTRQAHNDEQPGKVIHEARSGEMAALLEVPFGRYYGSIDATPLFVILAGAYLRRTGDLESVRFLWPHVECALEWIERDGDVDGDGFYEYARLSPSGLLHQGWKDSHDPVFHADGSLAVGPIALCEVQGYVYAAKSAAAEMIEALGDQLRAARLRDEAEDLRRRFEDVFWCEELSTYALALDGHKRLCRVVGSNPGHCLYTGIVSEGRAQLVMRTLMGASAFSGWGIRTIASGERRYNPMSYHNGSVWPHDNAVIAAGFAHYGLKGAAGNVISGLFDAATFFESHRLPELFCGFPRRPDEAPILYPVACSPQAWAAGAVFMCLQACLGLDVSSAEATVSFADPVLPPFLDWLEIRGLRVGEGSVDLALTRRIDQAVVGVEARVGAVRVITVK